MKSSVTMMVAMALAVAFCTAMVTMAEEAAPAKTEKAPAACGGCSKDMPACEKAKPVLADRMLKRLEAAKPALTEEQKTKVKELCAAAEKKVAETTDGKAKMETMKELHKTIMDTVLTAEQRESMPKRPEGRRHRGEGKAPEAAEATK